MRYFSLFVFLIGALTAQAQQGNWYLGGVVNYSSTTDKSASGQELTNSSWGIGPEIGTFLTDNIQIGLKVGLYGAVYELTDGKDRDFSLGPTIYVRRIFHITDNFSTFAGLYAGITSGTTKSERTSGSSETTHFGFGTQLGVGLAYALSPRFTVMGQYGVLGYRTENWKVDGMDAGSTSKFTFSMDATGQGSAFNLGVYYTLNRN